MGQRIVRIMQTYKLLDGWIDHVDNIFVLSTGVAFRLPPFSDCDFARVDVPLDAVANDHPAVVEAIRSPIAQVYRPKALEDWDPSALWLRLESALWIGQESSAPHGTGGAGVYIQELDGTEHVADLVPYWDAKPAAPLRGA